MLAEGTFDGKVAIVTGGGSGLGRAMALEFARLGAAVVVAGRRAEPLDETVAQIEDEGGAAIAKPTDVRDPEQVDALVDDTVKRFGRVDVLVNNAAGNFVVGPRISRRTAGARSSGSSSTAVSSARARPGAG